MKSNTTKWRKLTPLIGIILGLMVSVVAARAEVPPEPDSLYIGDGGDDTVKRFNAKTGKYLGVFVTPGSGGLLGPRGLIFTRGKLHAANQNVDLDFAGEILRYSGKTGDFVDALVPCNPPLGRDCDPNAPFAPRGLIQGLGRTLYVADFDFLLGRVAQFDLNTGEFLGNLDTTGFTGAFIPRGIVFGPDGLIYVSITGNFIADDFLTGYVLRFDPHTGNFVDVFTSNLAGGCAVHLHRPEGLVFGPDEKLYVTGFRADANDTDKILIFDEDGQCLDQIDLDQVGQPRAFAQAIVFGPRKRLFASINNTGEVRRYDVKTKTFDVFVPSAANRGPLQSPWYLTFGKTDPRTLKYED